MHQLIRYCPDERYNMARYGHREPHGFAHSRPTLLGLRDRIHAPLTATTSSVCPLTEESVRFYTTELIPPWRPPWPPPTANTNQPSYPDQQPTNSAMSGRLKKKQLLKPGCILGRDQSSLSSPQRKSSDNRKRTGLSTPPTKPPRLDSTSLMPPDDSTNPDLPPAFEDQPMKAKSLSFDPPSSYMEAVKLTDKPSISPVTAEIPRPTADNPTQKGVSFSNEREVFQFGSSPNDQGDEDPLWNDMAVEGDLPELPPMKNQPSTSSDPVPMSTDDEREVYPDLSQYMDKISWRYDTDKCFHWAVYKALPVKDLRNILSTRGQLRSGTKDKLIIRLEHGDKRRFTYIRTSAEMKIKIAQYNNRHSTSDSSTPGNCSSPPSPKSTPKPPITVEAASDNEQDVIMKDNDDAIEMFPSPDNANADPLPAPATSEAKTPPATVATKSTASATQSTVSSLQTPSSVTSSITGRLLNTRPRRIKDIHGVANFISIVTPPPRDSKVEPSKHCHSMLDKAFHILRRNDPELLWYPIWDNEPGLEPISPISDPKKFPTDLDALQVWARITNPWDLKKVRPGEIDNRSGKEKKQKSMYVVVLMGSRYTPEHVLEISFPSLAAIGLTAKKKDVDALESLPLYAIAGIPNEWDADALGSYLFSELEKHEEWMQGNIKSGYNASEFSGEVFPPIIVRRSQIRLPEGKDILPKEESEVLQYAYSLRKLLTIEVSACDKYRVSECLKSFRDHKKFLLVSSDADLIPLDVTSNSHEAVRRRWFKELIGQMNYAHVHSIVEFGGIASSRTSARGEIDPLFDDGKRKAFKYTCIRRELLDIERADGKKVFLGALDRGGDNLGTIQLYYFNSDENEQFIRNMHGDLAAYLYQYLRKVKHYSTRSVNAILAGFDEAHRLSARDSVWNEEDRSCKPITRASSGCFADKMAERGMEFLLPQVMAAHRRDSQPLSGKQPPGPGEKQQFSDDAKKKVAETLRFKNKPGYNPTPADAASCLSDTSKATSGDTSNRSVTTQDRYGRLPELRRELNRLLEELTETSPQDPLLSDPMITATDVENLSLNSSETATLDALFKDTRQAILLLKVRITELKSNGRPPPQSGSTDPLPSSEEGERGSVQGK